jgi:glycosyltransferase involved in cell wall biosynthesis
MNIGINLRAYDRKGGIGIYSRNIVRNIVNIDHNNHYVLFFNKESHLDSDHNIDNVDEVYLPETNVFVWDQILIPRMIKKYDIDIIFNTKFTVPIQTKAKSVMALHGASWYTNPEFYTRLDVLYVRSIMPIYCRKADFLISNSFCTTNDYIKYLNINKNKIKTVHLAAGKEFIPVTDESKLNFITKKYNLPDKFIMTVTSYEDKRKNFKTLLKAFENCYKDLNIKLLVVGKNCDRYINDFKLKEKNLLDFIHFPGWVDQKDLPAIYSLAKAFLFPSVYEEFGIPIVEAMSCGCPVVASNTGALSELSEGAAILCDPLDDKQFSKGIFDILTSEEIMENCRKKGLIKAKNYSWSNTAKQTIDIFNKLV